MHICFQVYYVSDKNQSEKIWRIFILQNLVGKAKFSTPTTISEGLQTQSSLTNG